MAAIALSLRNLCNHENTSIIDEAILIVIWEAVSHYSIHA